MKTHPYSASAHLDHRGVAFIPEHYEASYDHLMEWATDAHAVIEAAHAWRKTGRADAEGDALDAAVEKIYPSEDYA